MNTKKRHVPLRNCIACRNKSAKRDLLRIIAKPDGGIAFDPGGKLSGRGAYLCTQCAHKAHNIRKNRLEHTLRTRIPNNQWQKVAAALKSHLTSTNPQTTNSTAAPTD